jgi:Uma2 family endonuclease
MSVVIEKLKEYAGKGVQNIWLIDPRLQLICMYRPPTLIEIEGGGIATADGSVELSRSEIFAESGWSAPCTTAAAWLVRF